MQKFLKPEFKNVPEELKQVPQWVLWKAVLKGKKVTKVPFTISGDNASTTNPATWATFEDATKTYLQNV